MNKNTWFSTGEHFRALIAAQVNQGRYSSASEVVRAALCLLEEQEAKLAALRDALVEGEQSGPSTPFDFEAFIARKRELRSPSKPCPEKCKVEEGFPFQCLDRKPKRVTSHLQKNCCVDENPAA